MKNTPVEINPLEIHIYLIKMKNKLIPRAQLGMKNMYEAYNPDKIHKQDAATFIKNLVSYPSAWFHGYAHPWDSSDLLQGDITTIVDGNNMKEVLVVRPEGGIAPIPTSLPSNPNLYINIANSPIKKSPLTMALYKAIVKGAKSLTEKEMKLISNSNLGLAESYSNDIANHVKASLAARLAAKLKAINAFKAKQKLPVRNFVPSYTPEDLSESYVPQTYSPMTEPNNNLINLSDLENFKTIW